MSDQPEFDLEASRRRLDAIDAELAEAARALDKARRDYEYVERSKFARVHSLWLAWRAVFTKAPARPVHALIAASRPAAAQPRAGDRKRGSSNGSINDASLRAVIKLFSKRAAEEPERSPVVSIIIPVFNQIDVTLQCLRSIGEIWFETLAVEVIVVDDASSDATQRALAQIPGIDVVRNARNMGFVYSCNRGAAVARGRYVYFLNNDTVVTDAWLDVLVNAAEVDPSIGALGSKLVYPDGRLQEAGNIVWSDGSGWNYGREANPAEPMYEFVREVDYCSGASLLVRAELFRELGGFDARYAPAYYEDTDLCMGIRKLGYRVVYHPRSLVVHYEGISSGTSLASGTKRYQTINAEKFREKWVTELTRDHLPNDPAHVYRAARRRVGAPTVLVIDTYVPLHDKESGSLRLMHIVRMLVAAGYRVVFYPDNFAPIQPYTSELQALGVEVLHHVDGGTSAADQVSAAFDSCDVAWVCRPEHGQRFISWLRNHENVKIVYDTIDLHHVRMRREIAIGGDPTALDWEAMRDIELACARRADATVTVTHDEAETLRAYGIDPVYVLPNVHDRHVDAVPTFAATRGLLFIGGYNHPPNVDAAEWLVREIMPLIWRRLPDVRLTLLGSNPSPRVLALAGRNVDVPGYLPNVDSYFRSHRVFVAPLRYGAGLKGKIGEALSYGLPTVTTAIGAEGFGLVDGTSVVLAETVNAFADAIVRLYMDPISWGRIAAGGLAAIEPFSSQMSARMVRRVIDELRRGEPVGS